MLKSESTSDKLRKKVYQPTLKCWVESVELGGIDLVRHVREFALEGSVRRIRVFDEQNNISIDLRFTSNLRASCSAGLTTPGLEVLKALSKSVNQLHVEVTREPSSLVRRRRSFGIET